MLNMYKRVLIFNGERYDAGRTMKESFPEDEELEITWDNLDAVCRAYALFIPFYVSHHKKGRKIDFDRIAAPGIKEWKTPNLRLNARVTWELMSPTIAEIFNWHNIDEAIQYLTERNIPLVVEGGNHK